MCLMLQYADPVADLIDKWGVFHARLFRDSCIFHRGSFVKVDQFLLMSYLHINSFVFALCFSKINTISFSYNTNNLMSIIFLQSVII